MAQTTEERLSQLEKAHSRLFNHYQNLIKDFHVLQNLYGELDSAFKKEVKEIQSNIEQLKQSQPKSSFIDGQRYKDKIVNVISDKIVEWQNKIFAQMEVNLDGRPEIYKIFVKERNKPKIGDTITFTYLEDDKKLSQLKCI